MAEVYFYHLQRQPLEKVLPQLLEKALERGWRCVVQAAPERIDALDQLLWTYDDASFLPHGTARDPDPAAQPILLTDGAANPNGAQVRFLLDDSPLEGAGDYERVVLIFDGADPDHVDKARENWRAAQRAGHAVSYWQQGEDGRWGRR
ncbi:DNA polymerase III subunit chi [Ancylobacter sp. 6x-1]|uniref:DNA polymerase III subunit chi n=1 Tax=Ancylobacter crimeensis TaxID=2579147 RepID=A0ABT0D659_9HYPH|nr:DNA polymerase III subunit chi [Ancylobacter crimeensis]MCK0195431.1 DNA polymerase III subunit chi [Ancylobacter crimeensis]